MEVGRQAKFELLYNGVDISADIAPYLISATYTDHSHGKADDLQVTVEDRDGLWRGSWFPQEGASLRASIVCTDWFQRGDIHKMVCGTFTIDEIGASGPPSVVSIKAVSAMITTAIRREKRTKAWESYSLSGVAKEIASCHGLSFFWSADEDVSFGRIDQRDESDLSFLSRICGENGFNLKIAEEKLIVYQARTFDAKPAVLTIEKDGGWIERWSLSSKSHNVYNAVSIVYTDPEKKTEYEYAFTPDDAPPCGQVLKLNRRVESRAAAERIAKSRLRSANKDRVNGSLDLVGYPSLLGGVNIALGGFGVFSGKYFVETAEHTFSRNEGYSSHLKCRQAIGY